MLKLHKSMMAGCLLVSLVLWLLLLLFYTFPYFDSRQFLHWCLIVLLYIAINDLASLSSPTGELCSLTPSAISISQVINESDDERSACFPQVL